MIVKLTTEEAEARAQTLARLELDHEALLADAKESGGKYREQLKALRNQILRLSREVKSGEVEQSGQMEIGSGPDNPGELEDGDPFGFDDDDDEADADRRLPPPEPEL